MDGSAASLHALFRFDQAVLVRLAVEWVEVVGHDVERQAALAQDGFGEHVDGDRSVHAHVCAERFQAFFNIFIHANAQCCLCHISSILFSLHSMQFVYTLLLTFRTTYGFVS